jgi:NAD(P)H-dependent FMN reductase
MLNLKIIIATTREGRKGPAVAEWFHSIAATHTEFKVEMVDLATINLPMFDEPQHPVLRKYKYQHTKDWSAIVDDADAFVIVTAEYNYSFPASIKNALDYVYQEWNYKPVAFVSYGGLSGGIRSVQALKQVVNALKMVALADAVHIPSFKKRIDDHNVFTSDGHLDKSAGNMLTELNKWAVALKEMRSKTG